MKRCPPPPPKGGTELEGRLGTVSGMRQEPLRLGVMTGWVSSRPGADSPQQASRTPRAQDRRRQRRLNHRLPPVLRWAPPEAVLPGACPQFRGRPTCQLGPTGSRSQPWRGTRPSSWAAAGHWVRTGRREARPGVRGQRGGRGGVGPRFKRQPPRMWVGGLPIWTQPPAWPQPRPAPPPVPPGLVQTLPDSRDALGEQRPLAF